ncbi:hypothetical protein P3T24_001022 [Paraburkholderia sp. GAS33]|jgi:hypothetical protein|uniref:1-aminocyclopropane-1-carboxylate deaminase n=1 Tax=Paraburkholderia sp. GAS33 TaxID=3035130 RepID=UPI003D1A9A51
MQSSGESRAARWRRAPSRLTQVCIVTDNTVAETFEQALAARLESSPQVALLRLLDPAAARGEWLVSREHGAIKPQRPGSANGIERALDPLPRDSRLLLCSQDMAALEWLGGVIGQRVFFAHYRPSANHELQLGTMIGTVEDALRASLSEKWGDSY